MEGCYRKDVTDYMFLLGSSFPGKESFCLVGEDFYTGIPSDRPNIYLLIFGARKGVVRILANIEYSELSGIDKSNQVWLTGQLCTNEQDKYGEHLPIHGQYAIGDIESPISDLQS